MGPAGLNRLLSGFGKGRGASTPPFCAICRVLTRAISYRLIRFHTAFRAKFTAELRIISEGKQALDQGYVVGPAGFEPTTKGL